MKIFNHQISTAQEILIYRRIIIVLLLGIIFLSYGLFQKRQDDLRASFKRTLVSDKKLPFEKEIMKIIKPLRYSGIPALIRDEVSLSVDFKNQTWTLHNIHRYDSQGNILLEEGRYGLCGELASYTYGKIYPIVKNRYGIVFVRVAESGFFLHPKATHIVLLLYDVDTQDAYLLDPTFKRYGHVESFSNYVLFDFNDTIEGIPERDRDVSFSVDTGTPLVIYNDFISVLSVNSVDGKFDRNNFSLQITASRKHQYSGRYVFGFRKKDGINEFFEDPWIRKDVMSSRDIQRMKKKIISWAEKIF